MQSNPYLHPMALARIAPRPRDLFFALLAAASAAHTGFLVVLTWMRPGLDFAAILSLLILPFLFIALGFLPVVVLLAALRIALLRLLPGRLSGSLLLVAILSIVGIAVAAAIALLATSGIRDEQIVSSVLFGAAIGGVVAGLKLSGGTETDTTSAQADA